MNTIDPNNPPAVYEWTGPTGCNFREVREPSGTYYRDTTPRAVIRALESARSNRSRVRLFYGDKVTGRDWQEKHDVCGTVGRSMGWLKSPLLIHNKRSIGGPEILTDCIVRIVVDKREVYRHPQYHTVEETKDKILIATVPELLEALLGLVKQVRDTCAKRSFSDGPLAVELDKARATIAKAEGRTL